MRKFPRTFVLSSRLSYHLNTDYNYPSGNQSNIVNMLCKGKQNCNIVSGGGGGGEFISDGDPLSVLIY